MRSTARAREREGERKRQRERKRERCHNTGKLISKVRTCVYVCMHSVQVCVRAPR